jgi:hypothetical protein
MGSHPSGNYFITVEENGHILGATQFIYDGVNVIGVSTSNEFDE